MEQGQEHLSHRGLLRSQECGEVRRVPIATPPTLLGELVLHSQQAGGQALLILGNLSEPL